ncbi:MAG: hypothetical protein AAF557_05485 [Pseudomonadota bacterium]
MIGPRLMSAGVAFFLSAGSAMACANMDDAMAHFEVVKDAYVEKAPQMTPEMFPVWTGHLETFGKRMGELDFAGACAALDQASLDLGFDAPAASGGNEVAAPATQPAGDDQGSTTVQTAPNSQDQDTQNPPAQAPVSGGQEVAVWRECPRGRCWGRE